MRAALCVGRSLVVLDLLPLTMAGHVSADSSIGVVSKYRRAFGRKRVPELVASSVISATCLVELRARRQRRQPLDAPRALVASRDRIDTRVRRRLAQRRDRKRRQPLLVLASRAHALRPPSQAQAAEACPLRDERPCSMRVPSPGRRRATRGRHASERPKRKPGVGEGREREEVARSTRSESRHSTHEGTNDCPTRDVVLHENQWR